MKPIIKLASILFILMLGFQTANAQRRIGLISDIHPGFTSLSVATDEPVKAAGIGVSLMKWRSDNKFVTTSIHRISSSFDDNSFYLGEIYSIKAKYKASSLEFCWSKLFGNMEADDPFIMYRNIGFGFMLTNYSEVGTSLDGKTVIDNFGGNNFTSVNGQFLVGLGSEFRVVDDFYAHVDLNLHLDLFAIGFVPRIGVYYRLY